MGDTKLASSPTKPYLAELHQVEAELEDTNTLQHHPVHYAATVDTTLTRQT
jgi:hypothetical protein